MQNQTPDYMKEERGLLIEHSLDMLVIAGFDGYFKHVSPSVSRILGWSKEELLARPYIEFVHPDDREGVVREVKACETGKEVIRYEDRALCKDGTYKWISWNGHPLVEKRLIIGVGRDITENKQAEETLEASERRLRLFIEHAPAAIAMFDTSMKYLAASRRWISDYRLEEQNIIGRSHYDVFPEIAERWKAIHRRCLAGAVEKCEEDPFPRSDGKLDWVRWEIWPWYDETGKIGGLIMFTEVITERKHIEEALRRSESSLAAAQRIAHVGSWEWDIVKNSARWSEETFRIFGIPYKELMEHREGFLNCIHPEDRASVNEALTEAIKGTKQYDLEYRIVLPDRTEKIIHALAEVARENGRPVLMRGTVRDITDRRRIEDELRRSRDELEVRVQERTGELESQKQTLQTIIDNIPVFISFYKLTGEVLLVNKEFERVVGWSQEDTTRIDVMAECYPDPKDREEVWDYMRNPRPIWKDMRVRTRHGRYIDTRWMNIRLDSGMQIGIGLDVTEQIHLEQQLRQAQKMQAVGTLAGGIAHDFNNMLAIIIGNAEIALDDVTDETSRHNIREILHASMRSKSLVKQILTFSRKSEGKRERLHLISLIEETVRLLRGFLPSTIKIEANLTADSDIILADPSQIQQVLMNLATNAAHAMREDGGLLSIDLTDTVFREGEPIPDSHMHPGPYVMLTVKDTGTGMPEDIRNRIFEPFFTTKELGQGTGMGLAVVFGIIHSYDGAITVDSQVGKGSAFKIFLPVIEGVADGELRKEDTFPKGRESILVVDDEPSVAGMVSETLSRLGYSLTKAESGPEGWRAFKASPKSFDLVLTDHVMPEMTGVRLAQKMLEVRKDLPIILFTGFSETVSPEKAKAAGISGFLMKPVARRELAETVRRVLDSKEKG